MAAEKSVKNSKKKYYLLTGLLSLVFLIVGFVLKRPSNSLGELIHQNQLWELYSHISNEIGVAGLIAVVLALTIEKLTFADFEYLLKKQTKAIKENVFNYIMEHSVPHEITREIESQILKAHFVRRGLTIKYTIEPVNEGPAYKDYVKVVLKLTYIIENLTSEEKQFEIKHTVEQSPEPRLGHHVKFISLDVVGCTKPVSKSLTQLPNFQKEVGPDLILCVPGIQVHPGKQKTTTVTVQSQTIKHLKRGADYHIVRYHTCDIDLQVHVCDLELEVEAGTVPNNCMKEGDEADYVNGLYHWKSTLPLLAGQNVHVTWVPKKTIRNS